MGLAAIHHTSVGFEFLQKLPSLGIPDETTTTVATRDHTRVIEHPPSLLGTCLHIRPPFIGAKHGTCHWGRIRWRGVEIMGLNVVFSKRIEADYVTGPVVR